MLLIAAMAVAAPASADTRFFAYDAADSLTLSLTRGITFRAETRFMRPPRLDQLFSTTARGSALLEAGGPDAALAVLPAGASEATLYRVLPDGDGRALGAALCPGSTSVWLVTGRVRAARPLIVHAVGVWPDGGHRHCARLSYRFRGEWAQPPRDTGARPDGAASPITR